MLNQRLCCLHPNIIQLHEVFLTPEHLAIVSELAPGGDLVDYIERHSMTNECALQESAARWLFQQLIVAVDYCHQVICALLSDTSCLYICIWSEAVPARHACRASAQTAALRVSAAPMIGANTEMCDCHCHCIYGTCPVPHTLSVQLGVYVVDVCWSSEPGYPWVPSSGWHTFDIYCMIYTFFGFDEYCMILANDKPGISDMKKSHAIHADGHCQQGHQA